MMNVCERLNYTLEHKKQNSMARMMSKVHQIYKPQSKNDHILVAKYESILQQLVDEIEGIGFDEEPEYDVIAGYLKECQIQIYKIQ